MFINYRKAAKCKMVIFATLWFAGLTLIGLSGLAMDELPHQEFRFWAMMGVGLVGFFTFFWSFLGFIFAAIDYAELSK